MGERGIPAPSNVRDYLTSKVNINQRTAFYYLDQASHYSSPIDPPDPAVSGEVRALFRDTTVQVLSNTIRSDDGVTRFMTRANQILSGN